MNHLNIFSKSALTVDYEKNFFFLTLFITAVPNLSTRVVILLKSFLEVKQTQVVFPHGKMNTA